MHLLDEKFWRGQVFTGTWTDGSGGDAAVIEPATGAEIGRVGIAAAADIARSATIAAEAQREWAARPYAERAEVLRRAGDLWNANSDEFAHWLIREAGSIPGKAATEIATAAQECYEASALPSRPYGELLPTGEQRLSMSRRVPVGVAA